MVLWKGYFLVLCDKGWTEQWKVPMVLWKKHFSSYEKSWNDWEWFKNAQIFEVNETVIKVQQFYFGNMDIIGKGFQGLFLKSWILLKWLKRFNSWRSSKKQAWVCINSWSLERLNYISKSAIWFSYKQIAWNDLSKQWNASL